MTDITAASSVQGAIQVKTSVVSCDGSANGNGSGHPLIYLNMGEDGHVTCLYCRQKFIVAEGLTEAGN